MAMLGFHASHEQFAPQALLEHLRRAEAAGFGAAMCSEHFHPWSRAQGQSGNAWAWSGAAMATTALTLGMVNCPTGRHHPAVVAQAAATLELMFPGRFWLAVGSGEALNEAITGQPWPDKAQRNARLRECVEVMRALWRGECVDHHGAVVVEHARLFSRPARPIPLIAAALTPETARWAGAWADGLITVSAERAQQRRIADAFREGGGEGKPMWLQVKLSYDRDDDAAMAGAMAQWRTNVLPPAATQLLRQPEQFEALAERVDEAEMARKVRVSADPGLQARWLQEDLEQGFERLYLHNVNLSQERFIDDFGRDVLPRFGASGGLAASNNHTVAAPPGR